VKNALQAAKEFKVHQSSLAKRLKNGTTRQEARISQQILSTAEEKVLKKWCTRLTAGGYSASHTVLREMAEMMIVRRVAKHRNSTTPIIQPRPVGVDWVRRFLMHYPTLKNTRSVQIDQSGWVDLTKEALQAWFDAYRDMSVS
jgi:hypothetical protein